MSNYNQSTNALHAGYNPSENQGSRAVPVHQTSSYVFENNAHAKDLFALAKAGYIYTRLNNPTNDVLEQRIASLDGGIGAVSFTSGTSAISSTLLTLLRAGDHIVASQSLYGGTYNLLKVTLPRLDITTTFVDADNPENIQKAIQDNTRAVYIESIGNPKIDVLDYRAIADVAHANHLPFIVDNTLATPFLLKPIDFGADLVIYSLTKFLGGHGKALGGAVVDAGKFDWSNGKFPEFTEPSAGYHGLVYWDALAAASFLAKLRVEGLRDLGGSLSPHNASEILLGIETAALRLKQHSSSALKVAEYLESHPAIESVNYAGLKSSPYNALSQTYLPKGQSGVLSFRLKGGFDAAEVVVDNIELFSHLANVGDSRSLIIHPSGTTHSQLTEQEQAQSGIYPNLIRLSIGLEDPEDIIQALEKALQKTQVTV